MGDTARRAAEYVGPVVDSTVHLWDQARNPVFWLSDRTMVRDMIGNYDSLPDTFTLADYDEATSAFDVGGVSGPMPARPTRLRQPLVTDQDHAGRVIGLVALGDPLDAGFEPLVSALRANALVTSVRVRLVPDSERARRPRPRPTVG